MFSALTCFRCIQIHARQPADVTAKRRVYWTDGAADIVRQQAFAFLFTAKNSFVQAHLQQPADVTAKRCVCRPHSTANTVR